MKKLEYKWLALALLWVAFFLQQGTRQIYGPLLMIAFLFGCFSPTVLGWTKAHYSMSSGLASLALAYLVGATLLAVGGRIFKKATLQRKES